MTYRVVCIALVLLIGAGVVAEASDSSTTATSQTSADSTTTASSTTSLTPDVANPLDKQLFGPAIWRLPPVNPQAPAPPVGPTPESAFGGKLPTALTMKPADEFPMPSSKVEPAPTANFPLVLPGVSLRDGIGAIPTAPSTPPVPKLWEGGLNVGLDGAEGNSEAFNFRFGVQSKRKTEQNILTFTSDYLKQTAKTIPTTNRSYSDGRYEWLFPQSRWSCYGHETIEYNEFTSYNVLDTTDAGLGYRLIKNENTTLVGRFGGGFSNYCGGPDDGNVFPEAVFGVNLERKITKRQKFLGSVEYAVDVVDTLRYRLRTQAALEILLDESINLSMKLGVLESYNSLQQGTRGNDLDYAALVLWKF